MENNDPKRVEDVLDPIGKLGWPKNKGRDGERTPMQWDSTQNAGFGAGKPCLPVNPDYRTHNVAVEKRDPNSALNYYRRVISLRRDNPALHEGSFLPVNDNDANVLACVREYRGRKVLVALNMSVNPQTVKFDIGQTAKTLLSSEKTTRKEVKLSAVSLAPLESFVGQIN